MQGPSQQGLTGLNVLWLVAISTPFLPPFSQIFSCVSFVALPQSSWVGFLPQSDLIFISLVTSTKTPFPNEAIPALGLRTVASWFWKSRI